MVERFVAQDKKNCPCGDMLSLDLCCFCELSGGDRARGEGDVPKPSAAVVIIHTYPADSTPWQGYLSRPCHREKASSANVLNNYHMPKYQGALFSPVLRV
ncbi:hypothetical protein DPX16_15810 [Anabarilius grahami]|uniref:Uncharacterized protein n=1 Tax=Anabarilius grahami TaxID=495550 RepID=A0A3N0YTG6_ANAGA|nr:hypothetical protein DPX16_15810 [Anabarilius grahami]